MPRLSYINWVDQPETRMAGSAGPLTLPATNLAEPIAQRRWRATSTAVHGIVDFGQPREVGVLALLQPHDAGGIDGRGEPVGHLAPADTVRHRLDLDAPGTGALLDTGPLACRVARGYGLTLLWLDAPVVARWWRFDLDAPSLGAVGFVDLGRAWAGPAVRPENSFAYGWGSLWDDATIVTTAPRSGIRLKDLRHRRRRVNLGFPALTRAEAKETFEELSRVVGLRGQLLFSPDPGGGHEPTEAILGELLDCSPIEQSNAALFAKSFSIIQAL
ncbi:hypothetical protein [Arenibaculum sp.]|jgi:hypothetical protein|uniref:hypothetical protein n=1 Tax=Arenibaculum sp. TaxID=2865862 RepID=UPI002E111462|nr:hypothetical protein [Arenibaculum sp.]